MYIALTFLWMTGFHFNHFVFIPACQHVVVVHLWFHHSTHHCVSSWFLWFDTSSSSHTTIINHYQQPPLSTTTISFINMWRTSQNIPPQHHHPHRPQQDHPGAGLAWGPLVALIILGLFLLVIGVILGHYHYLTISFMLEPVSVSNPFNISWKHCLLVPTSCE